MITQKFDLNLIHGRVRPHVNVSQYDKGSRTLEMAIYNGNERFTLSGAYSATIQGTKPDNRGFQYSAAIDTVNNVITADVTEQMTAVFGDVICEVEIYYGGDRIGTGNFVLAVEKAALSDETVISDTLLPLVQQAAAVAPLIPEIADVVMTDESITTVDYAPIIEVKDAAPLDAVDVKVKIEPVQDLHGYTKPWVGGAGKNIIPTKLAVIKANNAGGSWNDNVCTMNGVTFTVLSDNDGNVTGIKCYGTATGGAPFLNINSNSDLAYSDCVGKKVSGCKNGGASTYDLRIIYRSSGGTWITSDAQTSSEITVRDNVTNAAYIQMGINVANGTFVNETITPMMSTNGGTFEPYENISAISGYNSEEIVDSGENLIVTDLQTIKSLNLSGTWSGNTYTPTASPNLHFTVNADLSVTISGTNGNSVVNMLLMDPFNNFGIFKHYSDCIISGCDVPYADVILQFQEYTGNWKNYASVANGEERTIGTVDTEKCRLHIQVFANRTVNTTIKPMIRRPDTAAEYKKPLGKKYIINLGGTRYGAIYDNVSGAMYVYLGFADFDGSVDESWNYSGNNQFYITDTPALNIKAKAWLISNKYKGVKVNSWTDMHGGEIATHPSLPNIIRVMDATQSSLADFETSLSNEPMQVCYELATPFTVQLSPQQIRLLENYNALFANTGDIALQYRILTVKNLAATIADTQDDVAALIAHNQKYAAQILSKSLNETITKTFDKNEYYQLFILSGSDISVYFINTNNSGTAYSKTIVNNIAGITISTNNSDVSISGANAATVIWQKIS